MNTSTSIYRRMLFYFSLIIIASFFMVGEFLYQMDRKEFKEDYIRTFEKYKTDSISENEVYKPVFQIKKKVIVMMILYFVFITIVIIMIIKDIVLPIRYMIKVSEKISAGDLSQTVRLERNDDLASLGNVINELTSNLQELIAVTGNLNISLPEYSNNIKQCLYKLSEVKNKKDLLKIVKCVSNELKKINRTAEEIKVIYDAFKLYTIKGTEE